MVARFDSIILSMCTTLTMLFNNPSSFVSTKDLHENLLPTILSKLEEEGKITREAIEAATGVTLAMPPRQVSQAAAEAAAAAG